MFGKILHNRHNKDGTVWRSIVRKACKFDKYRVLNSSDQHSDPWLIFLPCTPRIINALKASAVMEIASKGCLCYAVCTERSASTASVSCAGWFFSPIIRLRM